MEMHDFSINDDDVFDDEETPLLGGTSLHHELLSTKVKDFYKSIGKTIHNRI